MIERQREGGDAAMAGGGTGGSSAAEGGADGADGTTGASPGVPPGQAPDDLPTAQGDAGETGDAPRLPPDVGDGRDDDIVARQLREAAMKEEDPELREKLWQEYRDYKQAAKND